MSAEGAAANGPLISLRGITKDFHSGDEVLTVLKGLDLDIWPGELVAIVGQSGSGKSTLLNTMGCLDSISSGTYLFAGEDVSRLDRDSLASLRRENFGFIFQRYQLLPDLDAIQNVELPAIYAGVDGVERRRQAVEILAQLGLGDRLAHRPNSLSGGQQQRVSIARALINGGDVIFADEPTGALDVDSGRKLMALFHELHRAGHTIVIVTHDPSIAAEAERVIQLVDGAIVSDTRRSAYSGSSKTAVSSTRSGKWRAAFDRGVEAVRMALLAMNSHKLRTFLTMLGIIIGIASVVSVVALGEGSRLRVLEGISALGPNTINVSPGRGFGDRRSGRIETLVPSDAEAIAEEAFVDGVSAQVVASATALYRSTASTVTVTGVGESHFHVEGRSFVSGRGFDAASIAQLAPEAVIDTNAQGAIFANGEDPIGKIIIVDRVPVRIIGVVENSKGFFLGRDRANIYVPYTTAMRRMFGQMYLNSISVRLEEGVDPASSQAAIKALLTRRHGAADVFLSNISSIGETMEETNKTMTFLISTIAIISLVVGGIGVMNIMIVGGSERTREIGIRMAVGARSVDIQYQFLIEAMLVCFIGGVVGAALSFGAGAILSSLYPGVRLVYSTAATALAIASSVGVGLIFGFMPARSAAKLNPVDALARE